MTSPDPSPGSGLAPATMGAPDFQAHDVEAVEQSEAPADGRVAGDMWLSSFDRDRLNEVVLAGGVHPDDVATLIRWAPLGLTHLCWRNTVVEDWHADAAASLSDGAMLMANVNTTRMFDYALRDLLAAWEIDQYACLADIAEIEADDLCHYLTQAGVEEVADAERVLPHGDDLATIAKAAKDTGTVEDLRLHGLTQVVAIAEAADERGTDVALLWLAARGMVACSDWWGTANWPVRVDKWLGHLRDPSDPWWRGRHPGAAPGAGADEEWLRRTLLAAPDDLGVEVADWCVSPGLIGFVQP